MQLPPMQLNPNEHATQRSPRLPHALEALPVSQRPAAEQHPPGQDCGVHRAAVSQPRPAQPSTTMISRRIVVMSSSIADRRRPTTSFPDAPRPC